MTLDEAVEQLQDWLSDFTGLTHREADLRDLMEQAASIVAALTLGYERVATFTDADSPDALLAGFREYDIDGTIGQGGLGITDGLKILAVHLDGQALVRITPAQYSEVDPHVSGGIPRYWYEFAGAVGLLPYPLAPTVADYELRVTYAAQVTSWTSGESVLRPAHDELLLAYAYLKACLREGRWQEASTTFEAWFQQAQIVPMQFTPPSTKRGELTLAPTAPQRLRRRAG
jgi:hypothetical protein